MNTQTNTHPIHQINQINQINHLLPQTQCRECGYDGCLPYAQAIANENAPINLCSVGGEMIIHDLSQLLNKPFIQPEKITPKTIAYIDEQVCIGCTACIRACPVDAIMGASKYMHTVLADECTGCGLCVAPCPVDCIYLHDVQEDFLPRNHFLAQNLSQNNQEIRFQAAGHALARYTWHTERKIRDDAERKARLAEREASIKNLKNNNQDNNKTKFNPADLIAKARARAQTEQNHLNQNNNLHRENFIQNQIKEAQERATYSRAMRDMQYGTEDEKAKALEWLRAYKEAKEAQAQAQLAEK